MEVTFAAKLRTRLYFFNNAQELMCLIESINKEVAERVGLEMLELAQRRYTWDIVAKQYFALLVA